MDIHPTVNFVFTLTKDQLTVEPVVGGLWPLVSGEVTCGMFTSSLTMSCVFKVANSCLRPGLPLVHNVIHVPTPPLSFFNG